MKKVYRLNSTMKAILIGLVIFCVGVFGGVVLMDPRIDTLLIGGICGLPPVLFFVMYLLGDRLVVDPTGITSYSNFPFRKRFLWIDCLRMEKNAFGGYNLFFNANSAWDRRFNVAAKTVQIYQYMDSGQSELLQDIRRYAPQVEIPREAFSSPEIPLAYKPGILLVYYLLFFVSVFFQTIAGEFFSEIIVFVGQFALFGLAGGLLNGARRLLSYAGWLGSEPPSEAVRRTALIFYISPITAEVFGAFLGVLIFLLLGAGELEGIERFLLYLAIMLGSLQLKLLSKLFPL